MLSSSTCGSYDLHSIHWLSGRKKELLAEVNGKTGLSSGEFVVGRSNWFGFVARIDFVVSFFPLSDTSD